MALKYSNFVFTVNGNKSRTGLPQPSVAPYSAVPAAAPAPFHAAPSRAALNHPFLPRNSATMRLSAATRKRIADAQKKGWAAQKSAQARGERNPRLYPYQVMMNPDISKTAVDLREGADSAFESFRKFCVNALNPENVTEENTKFCQVVLALCTATDSNYEKLRESYDKADYVPEPSGSRCVHAVRASMQSQCRRVCR
jgi:hypothetical protein